MAGKLSDKELRLRELKLKDAYDQKDLLLRPIAEGDKLLDLANIYEHQDWPSHKVYCSQCKGHRHKMGFTALVLTDSGVLIRLLFGSRCGHKAFGHDWNTAQKRIEGQKDRQWELRKLDRLDTLKNELAVALAEWRKLVPKVVGRKSAFSLKLGELASRFTESHIHHSGHFFVHRTVNLKEGGQISQAQLIAPLPGAMLFNQLEMIAAVERAQNTLKDFSVHVGTSDSVRTNELNKKRRAFEDCLDDLKTVFAMYEAAQDFFTAETFAAIADWTKRYAVTDKRYTWDGKVLADKDDWREFELPQPFDDLSTEPLDLIEEYRRAS